MKNLFIYIALLITFNSCTLFELANPNKIRHLDEFILCNNNNVLKNEYTNGIFTWIIKDLDRQHEINKGELPLYFVPIYDEENLIDSFPIWEFANGEKGSLTTFGYMKLFKDGTLFIQDIGIFINERQVKININQMFNSENIKHFLFK